MDRKSCPFSTQTMSLLGQTYYLLIQDNLFLLKQKLLKRQADNLSWKTSSLKFQNISASSRQLWLLWQPVTNILCAQHMSAPHGSTKRPLEIPFSVCGCVSPQRILTKSNKPLVTWRICLLQYFPKEANVIQIEATFSALRIRKNNYNRRVGGMKLWIH